MVTMETVGRVEDFAVGARRHVVLGGREVTILRLADGFFALVNVCPHANGRLGDGAVREGAIECPLHRWRFDLRTGATKRHPRLRAGVLRVAVEEGEVRVEVPDGPSADAFRF